EDALDHPPAPVDAEAVFPTFAGIEQQRRHQSTLRSEPGIGLAPLDDQPLQRRVEVVVADARRVERQHPRRDVSPRRPQPGLTVLVEAFEHLQLANLWGVAFRGRVEIEHALLDELQDNGSGDRLGAGEERKDAVGRHRVGVAEPPDAGRALIDIPRTAARHRDDAGNVRLAGGRAAENGVCGGVKRGVHNGPSTKWYGARATGAPVELCETSAYLFSVRPRKGHA